MPTKFTWKDLPQLIPCLGAELPAARYEVEQLPAALIRDRQTGEVVGLVWARRTPNSQDAPCLCFEVKGCLDLNEPGMEADTIAKAVAEIRRYAEQP